MTDSPSSVSRMRRLLLCLLATAALHTPAAAQDFDMIRGLFKSVNSISVSMQTGRLTGSDQMVGGCGPLGLCGMGTEVFLNLAESETTLLELALGTGYLRGFSAREPSIDLHGSIRSIPTLGVYASRLNAFGTGSVVPYAGINMGLVELWNVQAYDAEGREFAIKGTTYDMGGAAGVALDTGPLDGLFAEASYRHRNFTSVDYSGDRVPPRWPREIDLSAWFVTVGWQFDIARK